MSTSHYEKNGGVEGNTPGNCAVRNCAVEPTHLIFTREGNGRIWPSAIPYWVQWCRKSIWRSPKLRSHPCGSPNFLHMCIVYSPNDINRAVCTQFFFVFLHFIFTKMELLTHEAKIKGKHLASLELFLQSSIKIPLTSKKCLQLSITLELLWAIWLPSYLLDGLVDHKLARHVKQSVWSKFWWTWW